LRTLYSDVTTSPLLELQSRVGSIWTEETDKQPTLDVRVPTLEFANSVMVLRAFLTWAKSQLHLEFWPCILEHCPV